MRDNTNSFSNVLTFFVVMYLNQKEAFMSTIFAVVLIISVSLLVVLLSFAIARIFHLSKVYIIFVCYSMSGIALILLFSLLFSKIFPGGKYNSLLEFILLIILTTFVTYQIRKILHRQEMEK